MTTTEAIALTEAAPEESRKRENRYARSQAATVRWLRRKRRGYLWAVPATVAYLGLLWALRGWL